MFIGWKVDTVKISVLPKFMYRLNVISNKISILHRNKNEEITITLNNTGS